MNNDFIAISWLMLMAIGLNLPWLSDRILLVWVPVRNIKGTFWRWTEWVLFVLMAFVSGRSIEGKTSGDQHQQGWEFYVVVFCLALVAALPGFIYRYQWLPVSRRAGR